MKPIVDTEENARATEYDSAFAAGLTSGEAFQPKNDCIVIPHDWVVKDVNEFSATPRRKTADIVLRDAESLVAYLGRFGTDDTVLFASRGNDSIEAIIDYHGAPDKDAGTDMLASIGNASWCSHRVKLPLIKSAQWTRWHSKHNKAIQQGEFADLIDDSSADFITPTAGELLDIVSNVREAKKVEFVSAKNISNGLTEFTYKETEAGSGGGSVKIPREFNITIPVYMGGEPVSIKVRLRYQISNSGTLTFTFIMDQIDKVHDEAFEYVRTMVGSCVSQPIYNGSAVV